MTALELQGLTVAPAPRTPPAVAALSIRLEPGTTAGLLGPNGSGKSTVLRALHRARRPDRGCILLDGNDLWDDLPRDHVARSVAVLAQDGGEDLDLSALDVVRSGRLPHQVLRREGLAVQEALAHDALAAVGAAHLAARAVGRLSGGERQRVMLARALAQDADVLLLDEPSNHLDLRAQLELLSFVTDHGGMVLAVMHDLNLAAAICDELHVLSAGRLIASGATADVLTAELIAAVYGVDARVDTNPLTGRPRVTLGPLLSKPATRFGEGS